MSQRLFFVLLFAAVLGFSPSLAFAQRANPQVVDLNRRAMDAYTNMEVDDAKRLLEQALSTAESSGLSGTLLARTYANLGVVAIGGMGDNAAGLRYFNLALAQDGSVELDPLTSTPDIQRVFNVARNANRNGAARNSGQGNSGQGNSGQSNTTTLPARSNPVSHEPVTEQVANTAIPVFVRVASGSGATRAFISYRARGGREFRRQAMRQMNDGFGQEIPCADVTGRGVEYFVEVQDGDGNLVGSAGSESAPNAVRLVARDSDLQGAAPAALPGRPAPSRCTAATEEDECPPSLPNCHGGAASQQNNPDETQTETPPVRTAPPARRGLGDTCMRSAECEAGMTCQDNFCIADEAPPREGSDGEEGEESVDEDEANAPRFFTQIGFGVGMAWVKDGMPADSVDPAYANFPLGMHDPEADNGTPRAWKDCGDTDGDSVYDTCNVRIQTPGFVPNMALRVAVGYYVIPRLAFAAWMRWAPISGLGTLSAFQIGARAQYQFTRPTTNGFNVAAFVGSAFGQIQVRPPQSPSTIGNPFIVSGLNSAEVGAIVGYRLMKNFGFYLQPEVHFMFPTFLVNMEFSGGVDVGF